NLKKLVDVYDVVDASDENCHIREHALVKVSIKPDDFKEIEELVSKGNCRVLDHEPDSMILELSGNEVTVEKSIGFLKKFKILELLRSGKMAMISGNQKKNKPVLVKSEPK
ncbi:acetolactate synthase small subunit, partial [bacterium]|nr:acetolactate synthase small subunit [bacterium]